MTHHLTGKEPLVDSICRAAYPSYTGKMFKLRTQETVDIRSSWEGGSRNYFVFVNLSTLSTSGKVPAQSAFDKPIRGGESVPLPDGFACVVHSIFCGKDHGLTIIVNPATMNPALLPPATELTVDERIVLVATCHLKSSYGGIKNFRFVEATKDTGITLDRWESAKAACVERGLLNKAGAVTVEGRNAAGNESLWQLGKTLGVSRFGMAAV